MGKITEQTINRYKSRAVNRRGSPWLATEAEEIKSLKLFIATFDELRHQYSYPTHSLKKLQELEGGELKTMRQVIKELT